MQFVMSTSEVENHLKNLNIHKSKGMRTGTIYIAPVHKKENYLQISLISIISKTAEKIEKSRVFSF